MTTYLYELPTTGAISFSDICTDQSPDHSFERHISNATLARANLRTALKESKRDQGEKDYLKLVKILDEYLAHIEGIIGSASCGEIGIKTQPVFSWRTTLSANFLNTSPRLSVPSLYADLAFSLLTYAFALSNLARTIVSSLGNYEYERGTSDVERKAKDEKLNFGSTLLCRASGIFQHVHDVVLPQWDAHRGTSGCPPELNRDVNTALAKLALADAQTLAIRKLVTRSAYDITVTPGPPLPKSHPSPALLSKLHLECASLYSSARSLMKNANSKDSRAGSIEVVAELRRYLADEATFHSALGKKWLGVDGAENSGGTKGGEAVGFLAWAKKELEELKDGGKVTGIGKEKEKKERRKEKVLDELEKLTVFLKYYKKANDTLTFQPVPSQSELQACIPSGRLAVTAKPFVKPTPTFGPGSVEYMRKQAESLHLKDEPASEEESTRGSSYLGSGSYF